MFRVKICMKFACKSKFYNKNVLEFLGSYSSCCKNEMPDKFTKINYGRPIPLFQHRNFSVTSNTYDTVLPVPNVDNDGVSTLNEISATILQSGIVEENAGKGFSILPYHVIQDILQYMHNDIGLQWCVAIAIATIALRVIVLPTYLLNRGLAIRTKNHMPQQVNLQNKLAEAKSKFAHSRLSLELMDFFKKHNINPLKGLIYQVPSGILFCSMFFGIRELANIKLASLTTGGYLWFLDLTVADPFYILPLISCSSMYFIIKFGAGDADMGPMASQQNIIKFLKILPFITFPIVANMPAAIFIYWITNNCITFLLAYAVKQKAISKAIGLPMEKKYSEEEIKIIEQSFDVSAFKNLFTTDKKTTNKSFKERIEQHQKMMTASQQRKKKHD